MSSEAFNLDPRAAERLLDLAFGEQRDEFERQNAACDLRKVAAPLIAAILSGEPSRTRRMNHAQLISCIAYLAFVAGPFELLQRPSGYAIPKSLLCFAAALPSDEHLGVMVTVMHEERLDRRVSPAWPLKAAELFPRHQVETAELGPALQGMLQGLVDTANDLVTTVATESRVG